VEDRCAVAGLFGDEEFAKLIPADKKLDPRWVASLTARGEPETYTGRDLRYIGMPVGGICAGTLYLGGDGQLWLWNIFNRDVEGIVPKTVTYRGARVGPRDGSCFVEPPEQQRPVSQGFSLRWETGKHRGMRELNRPGFKNITFLGQYPIATVTYRDPDVPVSVHLETFSPFAPLDLQDSSLPATVLRFTLKNAGDHPVETTLVGWLENAVCLHHKLHPGVRRNRILRDKGLTFLDASAERSRKPARPKQPDVVFENWGKTGYPDWKVEGTAFGAGPVKKADLPPYQGDVGGPGARVVNSHATAPAKNVADRDAHTGKLTSKPFLIQRDFVHFWIGGGAHPGKTCLNLVIDGKVVRTATGRNDNRMHLETFDVRRLRGRKATIEIVDIEKSAWGNVGVGTITFSDSPGTTAELEELFDFGSMGLGLLGAPAEVASASAARGGGIATSTDDSAKPLEDSLIGAVGRKLTLRPGASASVDFVITWHFPNLTIPGLGRVGRAYAARFDSARAVAEYVAGHFERLSSQTRLWRDTWYDSTLPHWFLNRTFANTSILATTTCYRFKDGRFWAWEGIGCCPGTCTHVWHYAQAAARLFPALERDQRERVDFGLALDRKSGVIRYRAEHGATFAVDGQAGTILRAYREHQMSANGTFLQRVWPGMKKSIECLLDRDKDGLLHGPLHNTLDADWFGVVPWLVSLYHAALRAGERMAEEIGDDDLARRCRSTFETGKTNLDRLCWKEDYQYYIHIGDPKNPKQVGAYEGCHIDQVFGQGWAHQVNLGRVMDEEHVKKALRSLWRYNFTPDVGPFRAVRKPGRWYALAGDGGLIMVTFPFQKDREFKGSGAWSAIYFNECMSGFEYQVAGHMLWEGMVTEGLAITRAIHDRYSGKLRNPYNEIECSDHYARAMASYGVYLAACGFEYHGPKGHIGFAPRVTPEEFRAAFTASEGWGTYRQKRTNKELRAEIEVHRGQLRLRTIALTVAESHRPRTMVVSVGGTAVAARFTGDTNRILVTLAREVVVATREKVLVVLQ
jgi:uncharacterized protein (DUF608 family)